MNIGLYEGEQTRSDRRDEAFLMCVEDWLGRPINRDAEWDEEELAFTMRDQHGYNAKEAAAEIVACAATAD